MNKVTSIVIAGLIIALTGVVGIFAQPGGGGTQPAPTTTGGGTSSQPQGDIKDQLLSNFEASEDWRAYATSPLGDTKTKKVIQVGPVEDVRSPDDKTDKEKKDFVEGQNHILGVKTYFVDRGFDRVEVKPPHEYVVDGRAVQLSVWALGRQFRHTLYVKLRDYRGKIHKLELGRLNFFGWRKLTVTIPQWLPQSARYAMVDKKLHFVSLFVVSDVHEVPGEFYFYVDNLNVKTDVSEREYPGSQIKDNW